jgi:hypothetical protein
VPSEAVIELATELLASYRDCGARRHEDAGPATLALLAAGSGRPGAVEAARQALPVWLAGFRSGVGHGGLHDAGLTGFLAGTRLAALVDQRLGPLADRIRGSVLAWSAGCPWRTDAVAMRDYDLLVGASGTLVTLATDPACPPSGWGPVSRHLVALCDTGALSRLQLARVYGPDSSHGVGRVNTGLAHGVPGIIVALGAAADAAAQAGTDTDTDVRPALRRAAEWLCDESFVDGRGVVTWTAFGRDGRAVPTVPSRRQAWCYGTPGVAWSLWEAGRVLDSAALRSFATDAMTSLCAAWDDDFYLYGEDVDDRVGICHGAAGTLAVADAFARHTGLAAAERLSARLSALLLERLDLVRQLGKESMSLLTGASGVTAVMLTVEGGTRAWLPLIGLR